MTLASVIICMLGGPRQVWSFKDKSSKRLWYISQDGYTERYVTQGSSLHVKEAVEASTAVVLGSSCMPQACSMQTCGAIHPVPVITTCTCIFRCDLNFEIHV